MVRRSESAGRPGRLRDGQAVELRPPAKRVSASALMFGRWLCSDGRRRPVPWRQAEVDSRRLSFDWAKRPADPA